MTTVTPGSRTSRSPSSPRTRRRTFGPGDILLVEDTEGFGHSSRTSDGFVAAFVVLDP
jgi:hypothetical protein